MNAKSANSLLDGFCFRNRALCKNPNCGTLTVLLRAAEKTVPSGGNTAKLMGTAGEVAREPCRKKQCDAKQHRCDPGPQLSFGAIVRKIDHIEFVHKG